MNVINLFPATSFNLPEVAPLPTDHPAWPFMPEATKTMLTKSWELATAARALAESYLDLKAEAVVLRAERDALLAVVNAR